MQAKLKQKAINLRRRGNSYSDIQILLGQKVSKSTLSLWLGNLTLSEMERKLLQDTIARKLLKSQKKAKLINKRRRLKYLKKLTDKNLYLLKNLNGDNKKLLLSILYLGEGAKSKSTQFLSLGSSNHKIIKLYINLLRDCFEIDNSKFRVRIQCRADQDIKYLENYWKNITKLPKKQFYPTYIDKRTIGKPTLHQDYKGVCTMHYFDRSIQLELEILADSVIKYVIGKGS